MSHWNYVADTDTIPNEQLTTFHIPGEEVVVYRSDNTYYVYPNRCTHQEVPLSDGIVFKGAIVCRMHGAKFDLQTGACLRSPAYADLQGYQVEVRDDQLYIAHPTKTTTHRTLELGSNAPSSLPTITIRSRKESFVRETSSYDSPHHSTL